MSSEKYTRLLNSTDQVESTHSPNSEENDRGPIDDGSGTLNGEALNRTTTNGRPYSDSVIVDDDEDLPRMFTMVQNDPGPQAKLYSVKRLVCSGILFGVLCLIAGLSVGIVTGRTMAPNLPSPTPIAPSHQIQPAPVPPHEFSDTTSSPKFPPFQDDISELSVEFLENFTPEMIKKYAGLLEDGSSIIDTVFNTFMKLGFKVERRRFQTSMAMAFSETPNNVEIVYNDNTTKIVNENTDSIRDIEPFAAFSPNISVNGPLVYGNHGELSDLKILQDLNVTINGSILLLRLGKIHTGVQVSNAFKMGAKGILLYPDPEEFAMSDNGEPEWTKNALPNDGVIWLNLKPFGGDPSTPGYPGLRGVFRAPVELLPIPVQPISASTAQILLESIGGVEAPSNWQGHLNVTYRLNGTGHEDTNNQSKSINLSVYNELDETYTHTVSAFMPSIDTTRVVHIGCRYSQLGSSLTGSALSLASVLAFAEAFSLSFPNGTRRQVIIHVFDGTDMEKASAWEFAELYSSWFETSSLAYIDFSNLIQGHGLVDAHASPVMRGVVREAFYHVIWPEGEVVNVWQGVLRDIHRKRGQNASVGDDYQMNLDISNPSGCDECLGFYSLYGIPTIHLKSVDSNKTVPYELTDSQYDNLKKFIEYKDKDFKWTHMIASLLSICSVILSTTTLPPIHFQELGDDIQSGWKIFLYNHGDDLQHRGMRFEHLIESISAEMDILELTLSSMDDWYMKSSKNEKDTQYDAFRKVENRLSKVVSITRQFLRPRNVPASKLGSLLTFGPHPENVCEGTYFPMLYQSLLTALEKSKDDEVEAWNEVHRELSLIYTSVNAINSDILSKVS